MTTTHLERWERSNGDALRADREGSRGWSCNWSRADVVGAVLIASLVFFNEANFRHHDPSQFSVDWQIMLRLGLLTAAGLYGIWHLPAVLKQLARFPLAWFGLLAMWSALTIPLAVNTIHATAATGMLWCSLLFVPALLVRLGKRRTLFTFLIPLVGLLLASWFVYFVFPEFGRDQYQISDEAAGEYRLGGLSHPNGTGVQAAWVLLLGLALWNEKYVSRYLLAGIMGLGAFSLLATDCRTAAISSLAALAIFGWRNTKSTLGIYAVVCAVILAGFWFAFATDQDRLFASLSRTGEAREMYELNGRMELWPRVISKIAESPLTGYGHGCQRFVIPDLGLNWANYHAHNMVLHVMLGLGIVGGLVLLMAQIDMVRRVVSEPSGFADMVTLFVLVGGVADSMVFSPVPDATSFLWISALCWRSLPETTSNASVERADRASENRGLTMARQETPS